MQQMSDEQSNYNCTIMLFRIIAILSILICHIGTEIQRGAIAQLFDVGVQFFLFISGYLYASKKIEDPICWMRNRYVKVTIPALLYVAFCMVLSSVLKWEYSVWTIPLYILNAQGYYHFVEFLPQLLLVNGTQHLWFITVLFMCYLLTIVEKKYQNRILFNRPLFKIIIIGVAIGLTCLGLRVDYIFVYFLGYYYSSIKEISLKRLIISFIFMIGFVSSRLFAKMYFDVNGDTFVYTNLIIPWTYIVMTVFVFNFLSYLMQRINVDSFFYKLIHSKCLRWLDKMSYYIYLSHYVFLGTALSVFLINTLLIVKIIIFLVVSLLLAIVIERINTLLFIRIKDHFI